MLVVSLLMISRFCTAGLIWSAQNKWNKLDGSNNQIKIMQYALDCHCNSRLLTNHLHSIFLNFFSSITADFNISSAIRWAIQDQWSSGYYKWITCIMLCQQLWKHAQMLISIQMRQRLLSFRFLQSFWYCYFSLSHDRHAIRWNNPFHKNHMITGVITPARLPIG